MIAAEANAAVANPAATPVTEAAGTVIYAKDVARVAAFYEHAAGLPVVHHEADHIVLESPAFQLVVLAVPETLAATIRVDVPSERRTNTAIKPVLFVRDIAATRTRAVLHGGELNPAAREWIFRGHCVCDGHDPEGNVVQFRQKLSIPA